MKTAPQLPTPHPDNAGRSLVERIASSSFARIAKLWTPTGANETPSTSVSRYALQLIDRLTGKAYSADEIAANNTNVVAALAAGSPAAVTALSTITDTDETTINLVAADSGKILRCTSGSAVTVNMPSTDPGGNFSVAVIRAGTGSVTFAANGKTLNSYSGALAIAGQHAWASLIRVAANTYNLSGTLA
jgi:hypothetical protein